MDGRTVAFGPFLLDTGTGTLFRDAELLPVGQKGIALLACLLDGAGQVRTKSELMDAAWPDVAVAENNLAVQIGILRKLLATAPGAADWIATVPRVGYRFVGPMGGATAPAGRHEPVVPSLAVLPFQNLGGDAADDYFADGIVEDIITSLSRFRSFAVIARNSSFAYKGRTVDVRQVARDLGVRYVLEGSVRRADGRLRITAQLIDGDTGTHLWADRFDGGVDAVFDVQDRITESTIGVIEPQIRRAEIERSRRKRPESLDAYDLYLRALAQMDVAGPEANAEAHALVMKAVAIEPAYGPFLAAAVWALTRRVVFGWPSLTGDDRRAALDMVERALAAADGDPAVLAQCGYTLVGIGSDYRRGMQIIANAVEANPNNVIVLTCAAIGELHCGDLGRSIEHGRRAIAMSPGTPTAYLAMTGIAHAWMVLGDFRQALAAAERSLAVNPNFQPTHWMLVAANAQLGRAGEAHRRLAELKRLAPGIAVATVLAGQPAHDPARLAAIVDGLRLAGLE